MFSRAHLDRACEHLLHASSAQLQAAEARLHALSPFAVLQRGYALVQDANGVVVRSAARLAVGDLVKTRLSDGSFDSRVVESGSNTPERKAKSRK